MTGRTTPEVAGAGDGAGLGAGVRPGGPGGCGRAYRPGDAEAPPRRRWTLTSRSTCGPIRSLLCRLLLTGDRQLAEDLAQSALAKVSLRWEVVSGRGDPDAYVRKAMVRTAIGWRRRRWHGECPTALVPETAVVDPTVGVDARQRLRSALLSLPPRQTGRGRAAFLQGPQRSRHRADPRLQRRGREEPDRQRPDQAPPVLRGEAAFIEERGCHADRRPAPSRPAWPTSPPRPATNPSRWPPSRSGPAACGADVEPAGPVSSSSA